MTLRINDCFQLVPRLEKLHPVTHPCFDMVELGDCCTVEVCTSGVAIFLMKSLGVSKINLSSQVRNAIGR